MIRTTRTLSLGVATLAALALAAPAQAATYRVAGKQKTIDADAGRYRMSGGLIGRWVTTSSQQVAAEPFYEATGTEKFRGCIDRRRDRSCAGDPAGTLSFDFRLWALNANADPASLIWGACWHPIRSGTGDFRGAQGVLTFVDSPTATAVKTVYIGTITTNGGKKSRHTPKSHTASRQTAADRPSC
jgi:hypothetical protein